MGLLDLTNENEEDKGKTLSALNKSKEIRKTFRELLGCIPDTILVHNKSDKAIDIERGKRSYR